MNIREFLLDPAVALPIKRTLAGIRREGFQEFVNGVLVAYRKKLCQLDGFDDELDDVVQMADLFCKAATRSIEAAFAGHPADAYTHFTLAIEPFAQLLLETPIHFSPKGYDFFYRVRCDSIPTLTREELFHIPFEKRQTVAEQRYSVPGLPCLYLGGSLYTCWEEMDRPPLETLNAAAFWAPCEQLKLLFIADRPARLISFVNPDGTIQEFEADQVREHGHAPDAIKRIMVRFLRLWPLAALCSIEQQQDKAKKWKPEYIIPQLLLQWVANHPEFDGVCYFSVRIEAVTDDFLPMCNVVIPVREIRSEGHCNRLRNLLRMTKPLNWRDLCAEWNGVEPELAECYRPDFRITSLDGRSVRYSDTAFVDAEWTLNRHAINLRRRNDAGELIAGEVTSSTTEMHMTVLIEPLNGRFKASTSQPMAMETEGASREEALQRLRELASARLAAGELVQVAVPNGDSGHPWVKFAGVWKDHPEFDQFQQNVADHRQSLDVSASET